MIDSEKVWPLLLRELAEQEKRYGSATTQASAGVLRWQGNGKIAAYCRVLALDPDDGVIFNESDKVLLEARHRMSSCEGCARGWERYTNPNGIVLHRDATNLKGSICHAVRGG